MIKLTRIFEKLTGRPHQTANADLVKNASEDLKRDVNALTRTLGEYQEKDDPLVAMMIDIYNDRVVKRELARIKGGNGGGGSDQSH